MTDEHKKTLVIIFHGVGGARAIESLYKLVEQEFQGAKIYAPPLPYRHWFALARASKIVAEQIGQINRLCSENEYDDIIIIGYSFGAVIAKRVIIEASKLSKTWEDAGTSAKHITAARVEPELEKIRPQEWADRVSRLVLVAGVVRGWSIEDTKDGFQWFFWTLGSLIGDTILFGKPTLFDIRKGAPFVVQTRIRWMEFLYKYKPKFEVSQLLGTIDDMVPPDDSVDFAMETIGQKFQLIEVPHSGHENILELSCTANNKQQLGIQKVRREIISAVLTGSNLPPSAKTVSRSAFADELPIPPDPSKTDVVFIIHGIRDRGHWTKKIAARVKVVAEQAKSKLITRTPSYGFFPILPFVLPWYRRKKVEWLMDQYAEARISFPEADISFVGHSNGTFLAARALQTYPTASFKNMMFAGSVVRPDYPWRDFIQSGRVSKVYNGIATADWVVALFPHGLRWYKNFFQLGGAGHVGFVPDKNIDGHVFQLQYPSPPEQQTQLYVSGEHSAAVQESQWDEIANFIVNGITPSNGNVDFTSKQNPWIKALGFASPVLITVSIFVLGFTSLMLLAPIVAQLAFAISTLQIATQNLISQSADIVGQSPKIASFSSIPFDGFGPISWLKNTWNSWAEQEAPVQWLGLILYFATVRFVAIRL